MDRHSSHSGMLDHGHSQGKGCLSCVKGCLFSMGHGHAHGHHKSEEEKAKFNKIESQNYDSDDKTFPYQFTGEKWFAHAVIGVVTGSISFFVSWAVDNIADFKFEQTFDLIDKNNWVGAFFWYYCFTLVLVGISSVIIMFWEPAAAGSGIPEVKGYLNGAKLRKTFNVRTAVAKIFGVIASVSSGLCVGPEGPMIHIGALVGAGMSQGRSKTLGVGTSLFERFRNDGDRRDFIAAGAAAGVSAAFRSPVGGVLFSLEEAASFWSMRLTWRAFFGSMLATFVIQFWITGDEDRWGKFNSPSLITFKVIPGHGYEIVELIPFALMGVIGGVLGALFTRWNLALGIWRRDVVAKRRLYRVLEVLAVATVTVLISFFFPFFFSCRTENANFQQFEAFTDSRFFNASSVDTVQYNCDEGDFNDFATLFLQPQEITIKHLFSRGTFGYFRVSAVIVFGICYFFLACVTAGTAISSGLVVPMLTVGACYGRAIGHVMHEMFPSAGFDPGVYALVGASSFMGGVSRMTISLVVILVEITNDIQFLLPIMMVIMIAKWIGDHYTHPLYDGQIDTKGIPLLEPEFGPAMERLHAEHVMASNVVTVREQESVSHIITMLQSNRHNGFPVVAGDGRTVVGLVLRATLVRMVKKGAVVGSDAARRSGRSINMRLGPECVTNADGLDSMARMDEFLKAFTPDGSLASQPLDIAAFMNRSPFIVQRNMPLVKVYTVFRSLGLRHILVSGQHNDIQGIITRFDLMEWNCEEAEEKLGAHGASPAPSSLGGPAVSTELTGLPAL